MKKKFTNKLIACVLAFATAFGAASTSVGAAVIKIEKSLYNTIEQNFTPLDLRQVANRGFADDVADDGVGGWGDGGPNNDLRSFTLYGNQNFCGVDFDIINPAKNDDKSCIVLSGQNDKRLPVSVELDVNQKAGGAYFLHAASWASASNGKYIFVYADGTEYAHELVLKRDIADWWGITQAENLRVAWEGTGTNAGLISLGLFALENPYPEKEIAKLRLVSNGDGSYIHIVGVTLTDKTPVLPKIEIDDTNNPDTSDWWAYEYPRNYEEKEGTPLDGSFLLDAPAGKHGFATAVDDHLVFEDGTVERMFGLNSGSTQNFPSYEDAEYTAMALAQNGVNLVRVHMTLSAYNSVPGLLGDMRTISDTDYLDPQVLDRFHYYVAKLKERGIYIWLDLHVGRPHMADDDIRLDGTGHLVFFDDKYIENMKKKIEQIMTPVNPYTGVPLTQEPAIVVGSFANETTVYESKLEGEYHRNMLQEKYNKWLCEKYPTREELHNAWLDDGKGLADDEDQFKGTVKVQGMGERNGVSRRGQDNMEFLGKIMEDFTNELTEHYRSIGGKQLLNTGQIWGSFPQAFIKSNEVADIMDWHMYFYHPGGDTSGYHVNQTIPGRPMSMLTEPNSGVLKSFAGTRLKGYPYTISEWDVGELNQYTSEITLLVAAYSGMQNMYPMWFSEMPTTIYDPDFRWAQKEFAMDKAFAGLVTPASAEIFFPSCIALKAVTESKYAYYEPKNGENFYSAQRQRYIMKNNSYLVGKAGIADRDVDNTQSGYENLVLAATRDAEINNKPYVSLTDELYMDKQKGIFKLNTGRSQAACGFMVGEVIELDDIIMEPATRYCTIALSSLSEKDIYEQDQLLLTVSARARREGTVLTDDGTKIINKGINHVVMEPVKGKFTLKTDADVKVYALSTEGKRTVEVPVVKGDGVSTFELDGSERAANFEIVKTGGTNKKNEKVSFNPYQDTPLFKDVAEEDREEIERVFLTDTMRATGTDTFTPDGTISRGDFTQAFMKASDKLGFNVVEPFTDVTEDMYYYKEIMAAAKAGIVFGKGDGTFGPDEDITVNEINAMLERLGIDKRFSGDKATRKIAAQALYAIIVS